MKESKTAYIAGPITGVKNYRRNFKRAERRLKRLGYIVMNPAILPKGFSWEQYMSICLPMLRSCDHVYFLKDWSFSKGAREEFLEARRLDKRIIHKLKGV